MIRPAIIALLSLAATSAAGDISLAFPVDCDLNTTCHIQHLVDHDPDAGTRDFQCGGLTYDGHKGTDIALPSLAAQAAGVTVRAAAAGTVRGVRNDMADILQVGPDAPDVEDRECGNGVVIAHPDGYETQYCHLALGSISVKTGDEISAGTRLGLVGLSGKTQFPHLHFSVRHRGAVVDPFDVKDAATCDDPLDPIWDSTPVTPEGGFISIGLHDGIPDYASVKAGTADKDLRSQSPAMVGWAFVYMGRTGDIVQTQITGPDGIIVDHSEPLNRNQAQLFRATGRQTPPNGWSNGDYILEVTMIRKGNIVDRAQHVFRID